MVLFDVFYELIPLRPKDAVIIYEYIKENGSDALDAIFIVSKRIFRDIRCLSVKFIMLFSAWILGFLITSIKFPEFGQTYLMASLMMIMLTNFEERKEGDASAYSVYNNFERLIGAAEQNLEDEMEGMNLRRK